VRPLRVVACATLSAALATVAVSGSAGSWTPSPETPIDHGLFTAVTLSTIGGTATTTPPPTIDPDRVERQEDGILLEPALALPLGGRQPVGVVSATKPVVVDRNPWHHNPDESWYGPGFYGQRTACGEVMTSTLMGVANRTLPCGTLVQFRNPYNGAVITVPVVDRGPYVAGRQWDLTYGACAAIGHCWTGPLWWRLP
jgi:hypothetical protein